jgi:hypothetical protein
MRKRSIKIVAGLSFVAAGLLMATGLGAFSAGSVVSPYSTAVGVQPAAAQQQTTQTLGVVTLQPIGTAPDAANLSAGVDTKAQTATTSVSQQQAITTAENGQSSFPYPPKAVLALVSVSDYLTPPAGLNIAGQGVVTPTANNAIAHELYDQKMEWVVEFPGVEPPIIGPSHGSEPVTTTPPTAAPESAVEFVFIDPTTGKFLFSESG